MSWATLQEREEQYRLKAQKDLQQSQSLPSVEQIKAKWEQQVGNAKIAWGKLTEDELLESEGHTEKLAGLVHERYAISRVEAEKQVSAFTKRIFLM